MSSRDHSSAADEHTSYTMWQGVDQASPNESTYTEGSTYTDGYTYPDPTGFGRQTRPNDADSLPKSSHRYGPYFQTSNSKADEIQPDDPFEEDGYWSRQSETWDADQEQYLAELDPFPEVTQHLGIQGQYRSQGQLSTATIEQTREDFPYNASSSRNANMPMRTANTVASGSIYSGGYPLGYTQQNISYPTCSSSPLEERTHRPFSSPYSPGHSLEQPSSQRFSDRDSPSASDHQTASSSKKRKRTSRAQRASRSKRSRTANASQGEHAVTSALGQKVARLGASMGSDRRQRAETRVENGVLFGLVDNEWKPAGYHLDFRRRLILKDAQQPGAPVPPMFQQGIPPNYTSYSPITQGWNDDDLTSMRDSQGRHAFLMANPPPDWQHSPYSGYMMYNGLVMLDQNNRPVKDYPGAPLTISYDAKASLVEGLRRYFGMTYSDITGRMPPERHTNTGIRPILGVTLISTRVGRWYERHKDRGLGPWFDRGGGK